jgi:FeoC like transcriptional regulator
MLERLLQLLRTGKPSRVDELAHALQTTPQLVALMLDDLARLGYLTPFAKACSRGCPGCPRVGACVCTGDGRAWVLTDRGAGHPV